MMTYLDNYKIVDGNVVDGDGAVKDATILRVVVCKKSDGTSFLAYKLADKSGKLIDACFKKDAQNVPAFPEANGDYIIVFGDEKPSVAKNRLYPKAYIPTITGVMASAQGFRPRYQLL